MNRLQTIDLSNLLPMLNTANQSNVPRSWLPRKLEKKRLKDQEEITESRAKIAKSIDEETMHRINTIIRVLHMQDNIDLAGRRIKADVEYLDSLKQYNETNILKLLLETQLLQEKVTQAKLESKSQESEIDEKIRTIKEYFRGNKET